MMPRVINRTTYKIPTPNHSMLGPSNFGFAPTRRACTYALDSSTTAGRRHRPLGVNSRSGLPDDGSRRIGLQLRDDPGHDLADLGRVARDVAPGVLERLDLRRRRSLAAGDDRSGVTHLLARRRGEPGDVRDHGLLHLVLHELGRFLLARGAD